MSDKISSQNLFLRTAKNRFTYGDLWKFEAFLSDFLLRYKITEAHPLAIWAISSDLTVFLAAACWNRGIPFVCFNPHEKPRELNRQIRALQPRLLIRDETAATPRLDHTGLAVKSLLLSDILNEKKSNGNKAKEAEALRRNDIFSYFFTSGTSGTSKIVPLKRRQMHVAAKASAQNIKPNPDHCWLLCMPLHHVGGVTLILRSVIYGSAIYRMPHFETSRAASLLSNDDSITVVSLVPTMLKRLLDQPDFTVHTDFRGLLLGGGPVSPDLLQAALNRGIPVIPSFGMTETCAQIAANPITPNTPEHKLHSAGKLFKPNKIEIRDERGQPVKAPQLGGIWLKGPQLFDGYLHGPADVIDANGWFNTGDYGHLDENGNLFVEARRTDLIVTGGENVSPFEVEQALNALEGVETTAVFGVEDAEWGQRVVAAVVGTPAKKPSAQSLHFALQQRLPSYKIPKQFIFVDVLPRTATGKIRRLELKELLG